MSTIHERNNRINLTDEEVQMIIDSLAIASSGDVHAFWDWDYQILLAELACRLSETSDIRASDNVLLADGFDVENPLSNKILKNFIKPLE